MLIPSDNYLYTSVFQVFQQKGHSRSVTFDLHVNNMDTAATV